MKELCLECECPTKCHSCSVFYELNDIKKICVIAGCSQKKLKYAAPAKDLNQGQLFRMIKKLAINHNFTLKILSGKYGLLDADQVIEPYNQKISSKKDISRVRTQTLPKLLEIWQNYDEIIIILGNNYRKVLEPLFDRKFIVIYDKRGIGGYLSLISKYNKLTTRQLLKEIEEFRILEFNQNLLEKVKILEGI